MTKAQRILALDDGIRTTREIGGIVDCDPAYVRVVLRQRKGGAQSEIDRRYMDSPLGQASRKRTYIKCSPRKMAWLKTIRATGNREAARVAGREAYASARAAGKSVRQANGIYALAWDGSMRATADRGKARRARKAAPFLSIPRSDDRTSASPDARGA